MIRRELENYMQRQLVMAIQGSDDITRGTLCGLKLVIG
jgi:hypothetical protein